MAFSISPAVVVKELDATTIIPAVSSTEGAIGGVFEWGPVEDRTLVSTEDELVLNFGKPTDRNFETWFSAANFLAYGSPLYVSRAADANAFNSACGNGSIANTQIKNLSAFEIGEGTFNSNAFFFAKYPGTVGNSLKISVCDSANAYNTVIASPNTSVYTLNVAFTVGSNTAVVTITDLAANNVNSNTVATALTNSLRVGDYVVGGNSTIGTQALKVSAIGQVASANGVAVANISFSSLYSLSTNVSIDQVNRYWEYYNAVDGAPGTSTYVSQRGGSGDELHIVVADEDGAITGTAGTILEVWEDLSRATNALGEQGGTIYYKNVLKTGSRYVYANADRPGTTSTTASLVTSINTLPYTASFTGGTDSVNETSISLQFLAKAYDQYKSAEDIDISIIVGGKSVGGLMGEGLPNYIIDNILETRKDCVGLFSPPRSSVVNNPLATEESVVAFRNLLRSTSYAQADSGYKYQYDKYNDVYRYIPLNGDAAGTLARTDNDRDPWWSNAGFNRGIIKNVTKLSWNPNKAQRDVIYKSGINPVVTFPGDGTVLYGDKTLLAKPSAFDRINVRRLFIVLEKAIATAAKYSLFEFNDEFTRASFRNMVEPYLRDIKGRRGIYDFRVVCDTTNNTPEVIDRNEFKADIYIKPARSINFIILTFTAVRTGVEFDEIVGKI